MSDEKKRDDVSSAAALRDISADDPRLSDMHRLVRCARNAAYGGSDKHAIDDLIDVVEELVNRSGAIDCEEWREARRASKSPGQLAREGYFSGAVATGPWEGIGDSEKASWEAAAVAVKGSK